MQNYFYTRKLHRKYRGEQRFNQILELARRKGIYFEPNQYHYIKKFATRYSSLETNIETLLHAVCLLLRVKVNEDLDLDYNAIDLGLIFMYEKSRPVPPALELFELKVTEEK